HDDGYDRGYRQGRLIGAVTGLILGGVISVLLSFRSAGPDVVVHMPADAAPLESLAPLPEGTRVVTEDRAVLWWTVFKHAMDKGYGRVADTYADRAVRAAYPTTSNER